MLGPDLVIDVRRGDALEWRANALAAALRAGRRRGGTRRAGRRAGHRRAVGPGAGGGPAGERPAGAGGGGGAHAGRAAAVERALADAAGAHRSTGPGPARPGPHAGGKVSGRADHELHPGAVVERRAARLERSPATRGSAIARWRRCSRSWPARSRRSPSHTSSPAWLAIRRCSISPRPKATPRPPPRPRKAADFILATTADEIVRFATSWTDDMFMATSILARAAEQTRGGAVRGRRGEVADHLRAAPAARGSAVHPRRERAARLGPRQRLRGVRADGGADAPAGVVAGAAAGARDLPPADERPPPAPGA